MSADRSRFLPGPVAPLDVAAILAAPAPDPLEPFVRDQVDALEGAHGRIDAAMGVMQDDLDHPDLETFAELVGTAADAHQAHDETPDDSLDPELARAEAAAVQFATIAQDLPPDNYQPEPSRIVDQGDAFDGADVDYDVITQLPATVDRRLDALSGEIDELRDRIGEGGGGGGGGGGGSAPGPCEQLAIYADEHPDEAAEIARFLQDNPGDCGRAPAAIGLADWRAFLERHGW